MPRMPIRIAVGERVFLRKPAVRDREEYLALRRDSARFLARWEPRPPATRTPSRQFTDWIGVRHARQGYMTEALPLALRHAFRTLRLHRVEANILPVNRASLALVRRAGFRREGYSPRYLEIAGRWADHERWALLAEDWRPR